MKRTPRLFLGTLAVFSGLAPGCGGGHDRQMIYTQPRVAPVRVDTGNGVRVPSRKPVPPSNGIDVPMFEPE